MVKERLDLSKVAESAVESVMERTGHTREQVERLTPYQFVTAWAGYELADEGWATEILQMYAVLTGTKIRYRWEEPAV